MTKFEAAVIGAGPTGLVAALALARMGVEVALIGPRDGVSRSPASPTLDDETERRHSVASRLVGEGQGGGESQTSKGGVPPTPNPSPQGGGESAQRLFRFRPLATDVEDRTTGLREGSAPRPTPAADQRTTALVGPSIALLKNLGVWGVESTADCRLAPGQAGAAPGSDPEGLTPIVAVRIADDRSGLIRAPEALFRASELGLESFGANIANPMLLAGLRKAAEGAQGLVRIETAGVATLAPGPAAARLELAEGGVVEAALAVAADGRNSIARKAAGIAADTWAYPQAALVTRFAHTRPHGGIVNELHRDAGPMTSVPLPGATSALVWVEEPAAARQLAGLDDRAFAVLLEERLQGVLGSVGGLGPRALHPLIGLRARSMTGPRVALVGEAAHVIPPVGAQGLNLGLRDAAQLADCAAEAKAGGGDIGGPAALAAYERARAWDVLGRSVSIDLLNRSLLADMLPVDMLRGLAAHLAVSFAPLRRFLMQEGMGLAGRLPSLMRS